jgi:hypothetical protein
MPFFFCAFEFGSFQRLWESRKSHGSAGLRVSLPSIFPRREPLGRRIGVVSQSNHSRTLPSSRAQAEGSLRSNGRSSVLWAYNQGED